MAFWGRNNLPSKKSPPDIIKPGNGVNTWDNPFEIEETEATVSLNTSNRHYPALATRPGTTSQYGSDVTALVGVNGATARASTTFHVVEGTTWKYWNGSSYTNVATGLADANAKFLEFTTATKKYTVMFNGTEKKAYDGTTVIDLTDLTETTDLISANDNRMFALIDSTIYTSDIGDITNWTTGDADRINLTGMIGSGTALINYHDMTIGWSDQTMHIVYGKIKDDFDPTEPINTGNVSDKSTLIHGENGVLYWLDYGKFMAFTGGLPINISKKVTKYLENINYTYKDKIISGQNRQYIYISFPYETATSNNLTLEYDTERNLWYPMNKGYDEFFTIGQDLYGVDSDGVVRKMIQGTADDSTAITWSHTMGVKDGLPLKNLKHITDLYALVDLPISSTLILSYSTTVDNDDFATLYTFTSNADEQNQRIRIPTTILQRINWFRLKLSGTGPCKVHYLEVHGRQGN